VFFPAGECLGQQREQKQQQKNNGQTVAVEK
jgi:hypothetical protein